MYILVFKGLSNDEVGGARGTILEEVWPGAGFKTGDSVQETLGGVPLERVRSLHICPPLSRVSWVALQALTMKNRFISIVLTPYKFVMFVVGLGFYLDVCT